jgi:hypothetical protein
VYIKEASSRTVGTENTTLIKFHEVSITKTQDTIKLGILNVI